MIVFKKSMELQNWLSKQSGSEKKIGFVPTMGALHYGHISLIEASKKVNNITIASVFINPTQFNDSSDFDRYPVTLKQDIKLLKEANCDILFLPSVDDIYPNGTFLKKKYDLGILEEILEGQFRPGHYHGVCMVVHRLLDIVMPDNLYLGQKDFQQCMVISKLITLLGLNEKIAITICPTIREKDGLAMSSRNMRLNTKERKTAAAIFETLTFINNQYPEIDLKKIKEVATKKLESTGFKVDYVEIMNASTFTILNERNKELKAIVLIAAYINEIRLIDNLILI